MPVHGRPRVGVVGRHGVVYVMLRCACIRLLSNWRGRMLSSCRQMSCGIDRGSIRPWSQMGGPVVNGGAAVADGVRLMRCSGEEEVHW